MPLPVDDVPIAITEPVDYLLFLFADFAYDNRSPFCGQWPVTSIHLHCKRGRNKG
jgi:hypothetical protein